MILKNEQLIFLSSIVILQNIITQIFLNEEDRDYIMTARKTI